ncbi:hypothetical protein KL911_004811 [Ogataea haglerorum]|nr:uncharacterized protein KL911_004811 [Ogataea haglerorum]KAG7750079.1 hypothetical protein KL911_004811 [Ogataea haglerorum]
MSDETLPSLDEFKLHNLLKAIPEAQRDLIQAILRVSRCYTKDLDTQCGEIVSIEKEEVMDRLDRVQRSYESIKAVDRTKYMDKIKRLESEMGDVAQQFASSKERIDRLVTKIKRIEKMMQLKDRLFDPKTFHYDHYKELYQYGMHKDAKEKSPLKEQQFLSLEQEIGELHRQRSTSITRIHNPTHLLVHEEPVTQISETVVTATSPPLDHDVSTTLRGYVK